MIDGTLYKEELAAARCMAPGCTHEHHPDDSTGLVLCQNCHPYAGTSAVFNHGLLILTIRCAYCNDFIVNIAVDNSVETENICHTEAPLMVEYMSGEIRMRCGQCTEIMDAVSVRERSKEKG